MQARTSIVDAIDRLGGPVAAARRLRIKRYQTVQQWAASGSVPAKYCPQIERELGGKVRCEDLCPTVDWGYLRGTRPAMEEVAGAGSDA